MVTSDDKVGGWVKKCQNHDDVIFECPPKYIILICRSADLFFKILLPFEFTLDQCTFCN